MNMPCIHQLPEVTFWYDAKDPFLKALPFEMGNQLHIIIKPNNIVLSDIFQ
ncbi:hypothetical protein J3U08_10115 [Gilliamella sp. B2894]|uniref:hypothetical protein n=1 Tax=unclassified Gilliamella TaxID=2685620 RepID=UPI002269E6C2|nr:MULTISPECIES: hypothetical protein [unclassified Gilliamella]MCX8657147.1 hypothetical protein [Gilliamella sp. B2894]MCX8693736.1 hypothetical protein [Gilliamella sp. B2881]MCX8696109.1 hypothetical protein [Gilliamella sp. B2828]